MPGLHVSEGVERIRATCAAVSASPFGEMREMELEPAPSKERENRLMCSELLFLFIATANEDLG